MATIDYLQNFPVSFLNRETDSNLGKLWDLFSVQLDLLKAEITKAYLLHVISEQSGYNLDQIGTLVKQNRGVAETDEDYRISLYAAIKSRISSGSIPDILDVVEVVKAEDSTLTAKIIELFPAKIQVYTNMEKLLSNNKKILNDSKAAGVGLILNYASGVNPFVFDGDDDGAGFGSDAVGFDGGGEFTVVIT